MGLEYYAYIKYAHLSNLSIKASTKAENQLMDMSDSSWKYFPDTDRITGSYIIVYKYGTIEHSTHVPVTVSQWSVESEYNSLWTAGMA